MINCSIFAIVDYLLIILMTMWIPSKQKYTTKLQLVSHFNGFNMLINEEREKNTHIIVRKAIRFENLTIFVFVFERTKNTQQAMLSNVKVMR